MATAKKITKTVETITLELTPAEAEVIAAIGAYIGGSIKESPRGDYRAVVKALEGAGVYSHNDYDRRHPRNLVNKEQSASIYFREYPSKGLTF